MIHQQHPMLRALATSLAGVILAASPTLRAAETFQFRPAQAPGFHQQVKVVVEVEGDLKLNADGTQVQRLPLKVEANLAYVERTLAAGPQLTGLRAVRSYAQAEAKIKLRDSELTSTLRDERRLIASQSDEKQATTFSPLGPLTRDELDLVDVPGSGLSLAALLPPRAVKIGSSWEQSDATIARLLNLDAVNEQDVTGTLVEVEDGVAAIDLKGKVAGAVGGVSTQIELTGKLNFDLRQRAVTWLALGYKENRSIGHAQPGFEVAGKVRLVAAPIAAAAEVSDKSLANLPTQAGGGTTLIDFAGETAGYGLVHDRRWSVMLDRHELTILRLVDRGDLIAQCNISRLPPLAKGEQLTLEGFQEDVKKTLGKSFGQIVEAAQETSEGLRVLRVVVSGTASDLPIQWSYYHVSDQAGHRAALVFTIEGGLLERFAQIDRELVGGFHFLADKEPTPAEGPKLESAAKPLVGGKSPRPIQ